MARKIFGHWLDDASETSGSFFQSLSGPVFTILPGSGTAGNGKPIYSWDQAAAQIDREGGWNINAGGSISLTYAFRSTAPAQMPEDTGGFSRFSAAQITATIQALQLWAEVANITFARVGTGVAGSGAYSNNATILFGNYATGAEAAAAFAYFAQPGQTGSGAIAGDVWVNSTLPENQSFGLLEYGPQVLLHEIGHALGLAHPGDYNANPDVDPTYATDAVYWQDSRMFTVMSYFGSANVGGSLPGFSSGPQLHDIAAIQRLYGANLNTKTGDTVYGFNSNTGEQHFSVASASDGAVFAIWDAGGNDTLDLSGYSTNSMIDLRPESFSSAGPGDSTSTISTTALYNISIARGVIIENAIGGSGNDTITGNDVANVLDGRGGADAMAGGLGNDTYVVDNAGDGVSELAGQGADTVQASISYALTADVENLTLTGVAAINGTGNALDNIITGNALANTLFGGVGNDTLLGGDGNDTLSGQAGADAMIGGLGDDTYVVESAGDVVTEASGEGTDTVNAFISYALPVNIENLLLLSTISDGTGNALNNTITGNAANNTLFGLNGADTLYGLDGNDTLYGGAGIDVMIGGTGNDAYYVESAGDVITELSGEGTDIVNAWVSFVLPANIENLTLLGIITDGTGNALDNIITGNGANNNLFGLGGADTLYGLAGNDALFGGAGGDTMIGGLGDDAYNVDNAADVVVENASEGADTINTFISGLTLAANVENLTLLGSVAAGTGNDLANIITGNAAANTLDGGAGADTLIGAAGNDTFVFHAGQADGDAITDFDGQGANPGDSLSFSGYGAAADGANVVQLDATHWQINSADGAIHDVIILANSASLDPSDYVFG